MFGSQAQRSRPSALRCQRQTSRCSETGIESRANRRTRLVAFAATMPDAMAGRTSRFAAAIPSASFYSERLENRSVGQGFSFPLLLSKEAAKGEMCREPCAKCCCDERQHDELPSLQKVHATSSAKEERDCSRPPVPAANAGSTTMPRERASSSAHRHG